MNKNYFFNKFIKGKDSVLFRLFLIMITAFVLMILLVPKPGMFLSINNFRAMMFQLPEIGIFAMAVMCAMLLGGIDLSVVGIGNLSGIFSAILVLKLSTVIGAVPAVILGIVFAIFIGVCCGILNGLIVTRLGVPAMLATLSTMQIFTGIGVAVTNGSAVTGLPKEFGYIGSGIVFGIPLIMWIFITVAVILSVILQKRKFGFNVYLLGTSQKCARYSGIKNNSVTIKTFVISGILAAIGGVILTSRAMSAKADYGSSYILQCLLVAILGGISPFGGFGKVIGIIFSIITLQILSSGFNMMRFSSYQKTFIWGLVLILAMIINYYANKWQTNKKSNN